MQGNCQQFETVQGTPAADVPVMKYVSGFAMYDTRLAITSGSATGSFAMSELAIPDAFAACASTGSDNGEYLDAILTRRRDGTDQW